MTDEPLLRVEDLCTVFHTPRGEVRAVDGVSFTVNAGETLGVVGESGSGKSVLSRTVMALVSNGPGVTVTGQSIIAGQNVHALSAKQRRRIWGPEVAMVFQDPMTSLNPVKRIGLHLTETLREHLSMPRAEARAKAVELLDQVGIPEPRRRLDQYPHELSGGMRQRVVIAMALACDPRLLIADEPTTALDVTVQKQILDLLARLGRERNMATILISHDLGAIAGVTHRTAVMYAGRLVEHGDTARTFDQPLHRYTEALLASVPKLADQPHTILRAIPGQPPDLAAPPVGCRFAPRCSRAEDVCRTSYPLLAPAPEAVPAGEVRHVACHFPVGAPERVTVAAGSPGDPNIESDADREH